MRPMLPLRTYDYLCRSRARVLDAVRPLTGEQYARAFPIGPGSIQKTLTHLLVAEWYYIERMAQRAVAPYEQWAIRDETVVDLAALEAAWAKQADTTRATIGGVPDWDGGFEYRVTDDAGIDQIVTCTAMDLFTQLALHEAHHRAQVLNMLRQMGVTIEGDIDFNAMMMPRRPA